MHTSIHTVFTQYSHLPGPTPGEVPLIRCLVDGDVPKLAPSAKELDSEPNPLLSVGVAPNIHPTSPPAGGVVPSGKSFPRLRDRYESMWRGAEEGKN
jgi:hypothetical protein